MRGDNRRGKTLIERFCERCGFAVSEPSRGLFSNFEFRGYSLRRRSSNREAKLVVAEKARLRVSAAWRAFETFRKPKRVDFREKYATTDKTGVFNENVEITKLFGR